MISILIDHNMEGQAMLLWDAIVETRLIEVAPMNFVMFADTGLSDNTSDREVWRFAQANHMLLLTDNRSSNDKDALEKTISEENIQESLPVLTIGNLDRIKARLYRERCAERIAEIVLELENYSGTGRIFIP